VYAQRSDRSTDTWFKRTTAGAYYRMRRGTGVELPHDVGDFRLMSRRVVEVLNAMPERHKVYRLLIPWLNLPSGVVHYRREERAAGKTGYSVRRMARLATWASPLFPSRRCGWRVGSAWAERSWPCRWGAWPSGRGPMVYGAGLDVDDDRRALPGGHSASLRGGARRVLGGIYEEVQGRPLFVLSDPAATTIDLAGGAADGEAAAEAKRVASPQRRG
jgi:dolichol-phosphate mannosyltransferase